VIFVSFGFSSLAYPNLLGEKKAMLLLLKFISIYNGHGKQEKLKKQ